MTAHGKTLVAVLAGLAIPLAAGAMRNPAAVYCEALGYTYRVEKTRAGDVGKCVLPDGQALDAWEFLQGKVGQQHGVCARRGLTQKVVQDPKRCARYLVESCAVCVGSDGKETEVSELMGLSFAETSCGDGRCGFPENTRTCPADCPSGSADGYCDGIQDKRCDPDCTPEQDPDCHRSEQTQ